MHDRYSDPFDYWRPTRWQKWRPRLLGVLATLATLALLALFALDMKRRNLFR